MQYTYIKQLIDVYVHTMVSMSVWILIIQIKPIQLDKYIPLCAGFTRVLKVEFF